MGKITSEGVFLEQLETDPAQYIPDIDESEFSGHVVEIDLQQPMADILAELSRHPVKTRLSLNGTIIVARDLAHAKIRARLEAGEEMPDYMKDHPVYYAGPAKTPRWHGLWCLWSDHRRPNGFLCRSVPIVWWIDGDAGQGQPVSSGS